MIRHLAKERTEGGSEQQHRSEQASRRISGIGPRSEEEAQHKYSRQSGKSVVTRQHSLCQIVSSTHHRWCKPCHQANRGPYERRAETRTTRESKSVIEDQLFVDAPQVYTLEHMSRRSMAYVSDPQFPTLGRDLLRHHSVRGYSHNLYKSQPAAMHHPETRPKELELHPCWVRDSGFIASFPGRPVCLTTTSR